MVKNLIMRDLNVPIKHSIVDFINKSPLIFLPSDESFSGQNIKNGKILVNAYLRGVAKSHPLCLLHELGHYIETTTERVVKPGWGMKIGSGQSVYNIPNDKLKTIKYMTTSIAIEREKRAWAYCMNLMKYFSVDTTDLILLGWSVYQTSWLDKEQVFGVNHDSCLVQQKLEREIYEMCETEPFSITSILNEWNRKNKEISNLI